MATIAGSWIGGSDNQAAMKEVFQPSGEIFSVMGVSFYPSAMSLKQAADTFAGPLKDAVKTLGLALSTWRAERAAEDNN